MFKGLILVLLLAAAPSSSNYTLKAYDFGNGNLSGSSSNFQLNGTAGGASGSLTGGTYALPAGVKASTTAAVPPAPTFTNPNNNYYRLHLTLNVSGFPTDTKYLIAISDDDFTTTEYVQTDQTIGPGLSISNYQTYAAWGGGSGIWVLGLNGGTTYKVKVAALQGNATGSPFGPTATAATANPSVTFAVTTSLTSSPPFSVTFASLPAGSVTSGDATINASVTTNAENGGSILIRGQNAGLTSASKSYTISSATADLSSSNTGYGGQVTSTSQSGGGPITADSPFSSGGNSVGALTSSFQRLASFNNAIDTGNLSLTLKAKSNIVVPSSTDFGDTITIAVSLLF